MFWGRYGGVAGLLLLAGVIIGALFFIAFALAVPMDRGEEGAAFALPFMGGFIGAVNGGVAGVSYLLILSGWIRRRPRTVRSRGWVGTGSAAAGGALVWVCVGIVWGGGSAWAIWGPLAAVCALIAAVVAGPLTVRAARRAERPDVASSTPSAA